MNWHFLAETDIFNFQSRSIKGIITNYTISGYSADYGLMMEQLISPLQYLVVLLRLRLGSPNFWLHLVNYCLRNNFRKLQT